jgi:hypothetical protein
MKKISLLFILIFYCFVQIFAFPDEGMWLPLYIKQLNEKKMIEMGCKLTADDIYNINKASIKDAVVRLGDGFCTGEIVSDQGLIFTNHHCGYDAIAELSTVEHDFLTNGYWAKTMADEIPIPNMTISRLVFMKDVTHLIDSLTSYLPEGFEKSRRLAEITDSLIKDAVGGTHYNGELKSMFEKTEYYLLVYETFRDIRFVGAPPSAIGKFGGDTDNWMWPRHTGDFSVLRIYTGADGKPADYSKDNIPYKPLKFFTISLNGVKEKDFSMIMGYPGTTERYLSSYDIDFKQNVEGPAVIDIFGDILSTMKGDMDANDKTRLTLASDYASMANTWKYFIGQNLGLKRFDLYSTYQKKEKDFETWVNADEQRKSKYGTVLSDIENTFVKYKRITPGFFYMAFGLFRLDLIGHMYSFSMLNDSYLSGKKTSELDTEITDLKKQTEQIFKKGSLPTEQKIFKAILEKFYFKLEDPNQFATFKEVNEKYKGNSEQEKLDQYFADLFKKSILFDKAKLDKFLAKPSGSTLKKDPGIAVINSLFDYFQNNYRMIYHNINASLDLYHRNYLVALREFEKDRVFYPDANSTLRMSYGKVSAYYPKDAVYYNYRTSYLGILEKEDSTNEEFMVPKRLHELLVKKDFGRYAQNDTLYTCFLTTNDITGGNSGSPVMNADGQLIGIAFDGNWEAMTGDLMVNPTYNRTINVDIRYVLFVIDKFAGMQRLIDELKIIQN